jgi:hypothetical protein
MATAAGVTNFMAGWQGEVDQPAAGELLHWQ